LIGFEDVPGWGDNRETFFLGDQEIDAFGRLDDLYVIVDAKTATSTRGRGRETSPQLRLINGYKEHVIRDIRTRYAASCGYRDCIFIFWTKGKKILDEHQRLATRLQIALRDDFDLDYYLQAYQILENKDMVRSSFLKDISMQLHRNFFREGAPIEVNAIRTRIGSKELFTFLLDVQHLLKFAYVFRVETNNILASYQRLLNSKKIERIRNYIRRAGFFANNILVATDEDLQLDREDESRTILTGTLRLPDKPAYLEILDGQHRLLAYSNQTNFMSHPLCVTVISNLNNVERTNLFVVVNREQTKVPAYLLWDLYTIIDPNGSRGKISAFVKGLNEDGPFKDLIKLPRVRSPTAYLSFTNLCLAFYNRTNLFGRYSHRDSFSNTVKTFFRVIRNDTILGDDWTRSVDNMGKKGFVCTNNALMIQAYLLSKILRRQEREHGFPRSTEMDVWARTLERQMVPSFRHYLNNNRERDNAEDPYGALRKTTTNEGARREAADVIFSHMR